MKVGFTKEELENMTKKDLQKRLNRLIKGGLISPNTTIDDVYEYDPSMPKPVQLFLYVIPDLRDCLMGYIDSGDFLGLAMLLKSLMKCVDAETMKHIQELVERKENDKEAEAIYEVCYIRPDLTGKIVYISGLDKDDVRDKFFKIYDTKYLIHSIKLVKSKEL